MNIFNKIFYYFKPSSNIEVNYANNALSMAGQATNMEAQSIALTKNASNIKCNANNI